MGVGVGVDKSTMRLAVSLRQHGFLVLPTDLYPKSTAPVDAWSVCDSWHVPWKYSFHPGAAFWQLNFLVKLMLSWGEHTVMA